MSFGAWFHTETANIKWHEDCCMWRFPEQRLLQAFGMYPSTTVLLDLSHTYERIQELNCTTEKKKNDVQIYHVVCGEGRSAIFVSIVRGSDWGVARIVTSLTHQCWVTTALYGVNSCTLTFFRPCCRTTVCGLRLPRARVHHGSNDGSSLHSSNSDLKLSRAGQSAATDRGRVSLARSTGRGRGRGGGAGNESQHSSTFEEGSFLDIDHYDQQAMNFAQ
jgi:hypothetical protein